MGAKYNILQFEFIKFQALVLYLILNLHLYNISQKELNIVKHQVQTL